MPTATFYRTMVTVTSDRSQAASAASTVPSRWMPTAPLSALTPRELEALEMLASGLSPEQVAQAMGTTVWTVRRHAEAIRAKADAPNLTTAAFRFGFELGRQSAA